MKVRTAVRRMCADCKIVRRRGKVFVICKTTPKHKQRQPFSTLVATAESAGSGEGSLAVDMSVMSIFDAPAASVVARPAEAPAAAAMVPFMSVRAWLE